jgi:NADH-quinone oxidoreductase subunit C
VTASLQSALGELTLTVPAAEARGLSDAAHDKALRFEQLIDLCGVDYAAYGKSEWETTEAPPRPASAAASIAMSSSMPMTRSGSPWSTTCCRCEYNRRLRLKVYAGGAQPMVDSVVGVWSAPTGSSARPSICSASCSAAIRTCAAS